MTTTAATVLSQHKPKTVVKEILFGEQIVVYVYDKAGKPSEWTVVLSNIKIPYVGRPGGEKVKEIIEEPYGWEAREFLRKRLVGETVLLEVEEREGPKGQKYGRIIHNGEDITELLVSEGLATIREGRSQAIPHLKELAAKAEESKKNIWDKENQQKHVRKVSVITNKKDFVDKNHKKKISAIIEHVIDCSKYKATLLPDFSELTFALTGVQSPLKNSEFEDEAKEFVRMRLLQREVKIIIDGVSDAGLVFASVDHPKGNIAQVLLKSGLAKCSDSSMRYVDDPSLLRSAEQEAQNKQLKQWAGHKPRVEEKKKEFQGTVVEVINGESLMIESGGKATKYFLSSIRQPRDTKAAEEGKENRDGGKQRPKRLYDVPWLFEAREFLRKKLIGKRVSVTVDYELDSRVFCTIISGGVNVAEALVQKGLASVVTPKDSATRSPHFDTLRAAEEKAKKSNNGLHSNTHVGHRVTDISTDQGRAKNYLTSLQRVGHVQAVVEYVSSGSRLRIYIPKESCIATFLLTGVSCPRPGRDGSSGEPYSAEALELTKQLVMQREVEISVEGVDKMGNCFIGWMFIDNVNLSLLLVERGLASIHFSAEKTIYYKQLKQAEDAAKAQRLMIWKDYKEKVEVTEEVEEVSSSGADPELVVVTEVRPDLTFFAQTVEQGPKLEALMGQIRHEFQTNPPLPGAYTPRKDDLCAAKFDDDEWYRARVEKVQSGQVHIFYIDYGNRQIVPAIRCAPLPSSFTTDKPYANEFGLALVKLPPDEEYQEEAFYAFRDMAQGASQLLLNVEYKIEKLPYATLVIPDTKQDIGKHLISEAFLLAKRHRERRIASKTSEYKEAEKEAFKSRKGIWRYGDLTLDEA